MPSPLALLDLEEIIPKIFKRRTEYVPLTNMSVRDEASIKLSKEDLEITHKVLRGEGISEIRILEDLDAMNRDYTLVSSELLKRLRGRVYIGIDGGSAVIRREELSFLFTRAVQFYYSMAGNSVMVDGQKRRSKEFVSRAFFILDGTILKSLTHPKIETRNLSLLSVKNSRVPILTPRRDLSEEEADDPVMSVEGQITGAIAKLRHLTELAALDHLVDYIEEGAINVPADNIFVLLDGPLIPRSAPLIDFKRVIKRVLDNNILVVSVVKRISHSRIFKGMLSGDKRLPLMEQQKNKELLEKLFRLHGIENIEVINYLASDGPLLRRILKEPNHRTFLFRYNTRYKIKTEDTAEELPKKYWPMATYVRTETDCIYRLEMPYKYQKELGEDGVENIISTVFALIQENHGYLPKPIEHSDALARVSEKEKVQIARWLDSMFKDNLGIELHVPYGEV